MPSSPDRQPAAAETTELAEIYGDEHTHLSLEAWPRTVVLRSTLYDAEVALDLTPDEARTAAAALVRFADIAEATR